LHDRAGYQDGPKMIVSVVVDIGCVIVLCSFCESTLASFCDCGRVIEYVDHLHSHFVDPVVVRDGRYQVPQVSVRLVMFAVSMWLQICVR